MHPALSTVATLLTHKSEDRCHPSQLLLEKGTYTHSDTFRIRRSVAIKAKEDPGYDADNCGPAYGSSLSTVVCYSTKENIILDGED